MLKKPKRIRVFFGLPVPEDRAEAFHQLIIENNPKLEHRVKWVKPGNHHITVLFLGNIDEQRLPSIISASEKALTSVMPFHVVLRNIVLFANTSQLASGRTSFPSCEAHTVAINIQPSLELQNLHDTLNQTMASENFPLEKRLYNPHITLFRALNTFKSQEFKVISLNNEKISINKLILYQSLSKAGGSIYIPLHTLLFDH